MTTTTTTKPPFTLSVTGFSTCKFFQKATGLVAALKLLHPQKIIHEENAFPTREDYKAWVETHRQLPQYAHGDPRVKEHGSSPFVTLNGTFLGGCDDTIAWARRTFGADAAPVADEDEEYVEEEKWKDDGFSTINGPSAYQYDLIVIGGGPGGIACAKEAASLGARVALIDTACRWGLGGTCLNVGFIPKSFFHQAALVGGIGSTQEVYGWGEGGANKKQRTSTSSVSLSHCWQTLRESIQNHIRSVHFENRVALRDSGVKYLNGYAIIRGPHELMLLEDLGGDPSWVGAPRFVLATGAHPSPLSCPGGEHTVTTDELLNLEEAPGKTCVICDSDDICGGDGYITLELAGFLKSLGSEVTIATWGGTSSSLLGPAFDRECAEKVITHMTSHCGITIRYAAAPFKITRGEEFQKGKKRSGGGESKAQLRISFGNGQEEYFDTIVNAQGRTADLKKLSMDNNPNQVTHRLGLDPTTYRLLCKDGQTTTPHIYAVGDVVHPSTHTQQSSLSSVAIQAGERLARRLCGSAGGDKKKERKSVVPRVVLTPLEYASVGLTEEEVNKEEVQILRSSFVPLEWALLIPSLAPPSAGGDGGGGGETETPINNNQKEGFVKALVQKATDKVVGLHYLGPHAADVIQGFAVAMNGKGGLSLTQLSSTLGIVPSNAQALTKLTVGVPSSSRKKARK